MNEGAGVQPVRASAEKDLLALRRVVPDGVREALLTLLMAAVKG